MHVLNLLLIVLLTTLPAALADAQIPVEPTPMDWPASCADPCEGARHIVVIPLPDDCQIQFSTQGGVSCDQDEICSVLNSTTCWTIRFTCYYLERPLEGTLGMKCQTQPGNASVDEGNCNNYGVLVAIILGPDPCSGESCQNYGVLVVVGSYCDHPFVDACVGSDCLDDICAKPYTLVAVEGTLLFVVSPAASSLLTPTTAPTPSNDMGACLS